MNIRIDICVDSMKLVSSEVAYCLRNLADRIEEHGGLVHLRPKEEFAVLNESGEKVGALTKRGRRSLTLAEVFSKEVK